MSDMNRGAGDCLHVSHARIRGHFPPCVSNVNTVNNYVLRAHPYIVRYYIIVCIKCVADRVSIGPMCINARMDIEILLYIDGGGRGCNILFAHAKWIMKLFFWWRGVHCVYNSYSNMKIINVSRGSKIICTLYIRSPGMYATASPTDTH